jgi:hypothetical protein
MPSSSRSPSVPTTISLLPSVESMIRDVSACGTQRLANACCY